MKFTYDLLKLGNDALVQNVEDLPFAAVDVHLQEQIACARQRMFRQNSFDRALRFTAGYGRNHLAAKEIAARVLSWRGVDRVIKLKNADAPVGNRHVPFVVATDAERQCR